MLQKGPKKTKWAPRLLVAVAAILVGVLFVGLRQSPALVKINNTPVVVEVVKTQQQRTQGLSGRSKLEPGHGMLFVFDQPGQQRIWMKDMYFNIDVLWLDAGGRVVGLVRNMQPASFPQVYTTDQSALYVLEVPSGFIDQHGIGAGTLAGLPGLN